MNSDIQSAHRVDVFAWEGAGYRPFVSCRDWLVALMNHDARFDPANVGQVERHNATDEVFVLTRGRGLLFVDDDSGVQVYDMEPGVLYNVTAGTWHNVLGTRESSWLIVEANDTSLENSDYRQLSAEEVASLKARYPDWLK
jgi:mannose-6-phosphate isomerase-like protein (cupin superfamily)